MNSLHKLTAAWIFDVMFHISAILMLIPSVLPTMEWWFAMWKVILKIWDVRNHTHTLIYHLNLSVYLADIAVDFTGTS